MPEPVSCAKAFHKRFDWIIIAFDGGAGFAEMKTGTSGIFCRFKCLQVGSGNPSHNWTIGVMCNGMMSFGAVDDGGLWWVFDTFADVIYVLFPTA